MNNYDVSTNSNVEQRANSWTYDMKPHNNAEAFLVSFAARASCRLESLETIEQARTVYRRRTGPAAERSKRKALAIQIGLELITPATESCADDHDGPSRKKHDPGPRPRHPELLLHLLESTSDGCRWLVDRWTELIEIFDERLMWGFGDERKAIRLMGKSHEFEDSAEIRSLRLATWVMTGIRPPHIPALSEEHVGRPIPSKQEARDIVKAICAKKIKRLTEMALRLEEAERDDDFARFEFDDSPEGKELRRERSTVHRELIRTFETFRKLNRCNFDRNDGEDVDRDVKIEDRADMSWMLGGKGLLNKPAASSKSNKNRRRKAGGKQKEPRNPWTLIVGTAEKSRPLPPVAVPDPIPGPRPDRQRGRSRPAPSPSSDTARSCKIEAKRSKNGEAPWPPPKC